MVIAHDRLTGSQHGLFAGESPLGPHSDLLEHAGYAVTGVEVVVHHKCPAIFQLWNRLGNCGIRAQAEGDGDSGLRTYAKFTLNFDGAIHHIHNVLGNRHSQAGTLDAAGGGVPLPLKWLEDMGDKAFTHADPSVFYMELVPGPACRGAGLFNDPDADYAAGGSVFDGVAQ